MSPFFFANVLNGSKYWPTLMETVGLRVPDRNFRDLVCLMLTLNV